MVQDGSRLHNSRSCGTLQCLFSGFLEICRPYWIPGFTEAPSHLYVNSRPPHHMRPPTGGTRSDPLSRQRRSSAASQPVHRRTRASPAKERRLRRDLETEKIKERKAGVWVQALFFLSQLLATAKHLSVAVTCLLSSFLFTWDKQKLQNSTTQEANQLSETQHQLVILGYRSRSLITHTFVGAKVM